jgi:hypothetical protein
MAARSQFRWHRLWTASIAVAGTLLLHALFLLPLLLDLSLPVRKLPNQSGAGASAAVSSAEPVITVVFINESSTAGRKESVMPEPLASRGLAPIDLRIVVLSPDPFPAADATNQDEEQDSPAPTEAAGDQTQHAILYGRYLGQVQARIERAWMRPRTQVGAPRFSCGARITQNQRGDVVGIKLDHCNGTERWQQSLVSAIRTASPLPAPPDPSVYADRLWLTFQSVGFRAEGPTEGFEPVAATAQHDQPDGLEAFKHFASGSGQSLRSRGEDSNVIHLTIIGNPRETGTPAGSVAASADSMSPPLPQ